MNLGTVRIINSQSVFSNPKDNNVNFIITDRALQLSSSSSITIPYTYIDNIIIDSNIFTINLNRSIDTQLGSTTFLNLLTHNQQDVLGYIQPLGRKNSKITVHSINDFQQTISDYESSEIQQTIPDYESEENVVEYMSDLSIASDYYARIDSLPSSVLNCNVYVTLTASNIYFHNRRGYQFELPYSNIFQVDAFTNGLYLYTRELIYPFDNQGQSTLTIYTSQPSSLLVSIKAYTRQ